MKKFASILFILLGVAFTINAQVHTAVADPDTICAGEAVQLELITGGAQDSATFNNGALPIGWTSTNQIMFNNPCNPTANGTIYLWMGNASAEPRNVVTVQYDISPGGCQLEFFMKYGNDSPSSTTCEDPDLSDEGVHLQYSTNGGATWTDIHYWQPVSGHSGPLYSWNYYIEAIPPVAATANTSFRWAQMTTSGPNFDHWGLDEVKLVCPWSPVEPHRVLWSHGAVGKTPPPVYPMVTTTYTAMVIDTVQNDTAYADVTVHVIPIPNADAGPDVTICKGDDVTLTATGGTNYVWSTVPPQYTASITVTPTASTVYSVTVTQDGCSATDDVYVQYDPIVTLPNDTIIDIGANLILDAGPMFAYYLWSDGSTNQFLTVSNTGQYWVQTTTAGGCVSSDTINIWVGYSLQGAFTYANLAMTGMANTKIVLNADPPQKVDSIFLGVDGIYQFNNLWNASYNIVPVITKPWGGINSTDALAMMKHFVGLIYLNGIYLKAGDVDASNFVNSADALMTQKRYIGMVNSFPSGDWTWEEDDIVIYGANINYSFQALCFGDVNGTYVPPVVKQTPQIKLIAQNDLTVGSNQTFEMPFAVNQEMSVGAISLALDYPSDYMVVEDVTLGNGESNNLLYAENNGELRISWYNLEAYKLQANEPILLVKFRTKDLSGINAGDLAFNVNYSSEVADNDVNVIENVDFYVPKLTVINTPGQYSLSHNFPNPFESITEIEYSLKNKGMVNLSVFNVLGEKIAELVNEYKDAGSYKIKFDGTNLSEGIYFYKINVTGNDEDFSQSRMMVISR